MQFQPLSLCFFQSYRKHRRQAAVADHHWGGRRVKANLNAVSSKGAAVETPDRRLRLVVNADLTRYMHSTNALRLMILIIIVCRQHLGIVQKTALRETTNYHVFGGNRSEQSNHALCVLCAVLP